MSLAAFAIAIAPAFAHGLQADQSNTRVDASAARFQSAQFGDWALIAISPEGDGVAEPIEGTLEFAPTGAVFIAATVLTAAALPITAARPVCGQRPLLTRISRLLN